jgi:hypothetical protein
VGGGLDPTSRKGEADVLYFNDDQGRFEPVPWTGGAFLDEAGEPLRQPPFDWVPSRDHRRRLTQRTVAQAQGAEADGITGRPQYPRSTLFWNRGDGTYAEISQYAGVEASEWSWAPLFVDVDLDGFEDLLIPNGFERDNMNADVQDRIRQSGAGRPVRTAEELQLRKFFPRLDTANLAFRNCGNLRFEEVSRAWGSTRGPSPKAPDSQTWTTTGIWMWSSTT